MDPRRCKDTTLVEHEPQPREQNGLLTKRIWGCRCNVPPFQRVSDHCHPIRLD